MKVESSIHKPLKLLNPLDLGFKLWVAFLLTVMLLGLYATLQVFTKGLVVTGLNDTVTWGLWITGDTSFGAFSTGAFMVATAIYVFKVETLKPLARISVIWGIIPDAMALIVLIVDIGRPELFWHPLVYWNPTSFLWYIVVALTIYFTILLVEFLPVLADLPPVKKALPGLPWFMEMLHRAMPVLTIAAFLAALMHQSSLGAVFSVIRGRTYWYGPGLLILFVSSALLAGPTLMLLGTLVTEKLSGKSILKQETVQYVVKLITVFFAAFVFIRSWDLISMAYHNLPLRSEAAALIFQSPAFWIGEVCIGMIIPLLVFLIPALRRQRGALIVCLAALLVGTFMFRWNVILPGLIVAPLSPDAGQLWGVYQPNWIEYTILATALAFGLLVYSLASRYLPLFYRGKSSEGDEFVPLGGI